MSYQPDWIPEAGAVSLICKVHACRGIEAFRQLQNAIRDGKIDLQLPPGVRQALDRRFDLLPWSEKHAARAENRNGWRYYLRYVTLGRNGHLRFGPEPNLRPIPYKLRREDVAKLWPAFAPTDEIAVVPEVSSTLEAGTEGASLRPTVPETLPESLPAAKDKEPEAGKGAASEKTTGQEIADEHGEVVQLTDAQPDKLAAEASTGQHGAPSHPKRRPVMDGILDALAALEGEGIRALEPKQRDERIRVWLVENKRKVPSGSGLTRAVQRALAVKPKP
jgi:hypothetical protein